MTKHNVIQFFSSIFQFAWVYCPVPMAVVIIVLSVMAMVDLSRRTSPTDEDATAFCWAIVLSLGGIAFLLYRLFMALPDGVSAQ